MTKQELYSLSKQLNLLRAKLIAESNKLLASPEFRYQHFVDNSVSGFDCTYANITYNQAQTEPLGYLAKVSEMARLIKELNELRK